MSLLPRLVGDEPSKVWIRAHLDYPHDWCLVWPFSRSQAGYATFGGKATAVHRLMCEYKNGLPPTDKHQACHSCGRGKEGCVNPNHLSWKTNAENQIERFQHSGYQPQRKLTLAQVEEIRSLQGKIQVNDIARKFNVTPLNIHRIHAGKLWRQESQRHVFTVDEILRVRAAPGGVGVVKGFASEYGVSIGTIHRIRNGQSYGHVQPEIERRSPEHTRPQSNTGEN
jgi:HNH endonuclease